MNSKQKKIALAVSGGVALLVIVASCSRQSPDYAYAPQQQVVAAAPQYAAPTQVVAAPPVIVQTAPAHDGFLTGLLAGHLMSGGGFGGGTRVEHHYNNAPAPVQNITKNVTVNKTYVQPAAVAPAARPTPVNQALREAYVAPKVTSGYGSYGTRSTPSFNSARASGGYGRR